METLVLCEILFNRNQEHYEKKKKSLKMTSEALESARKRLCEDPEPFSIEGESPTFVMYYLSSSVHPKKKKSSSFFPDISFFPFL